MGNLQRWLCLGLLTLSAGSLHAFVADDHGELDAGLLKQEDTRIGNVVLRPKTTISPQLEEGYFEGLEVIRDQKSNNIRLLHGSFPDVETLNTREASAFVELCKRYVDQHPDIFGVSSADIRVLESALFMGQDEQFVRFHVYRNGIRVKDASLDFRFKFGTLLQISNQSFAEAKVVGSLQERSDLLDKAEQVVNAKHITPIQPVYRVLETDKGYILEKVESFAVRGENGLPYYLELDTVTGKVYELSRQFYNYSGHAKADVYPRWYDEAIQSRPLMLMDVQTSKGNVRTNTLGMFDAAADVAPQIQDGLKGQYVAVRDVNGRNVKAPGTLVNNIWNIDVKKDAQQQPWMDTVVAQSMIFDKTTAIVLRAKKYIDMPWFGKVLGANANLNSHCNAYWDGSTINLFSGNAQCANTALIADVVYHEWGHGLHHNAEGIEDGALSEGFGDIMSLVMTHSNLLGIGFLLANRGPVRDIKPPKIYPRDRGEVHAEGLIIASTFWELFEKLTAKYGEQRAGEMIENFAFKMIFTARTYHDVYHALLVIDSNGGNPRSGTPHQCILNEVFSNHGIAQKDPACELAAVESWQIDGQDGTFLKPGTSVSVKLKARNSAPQVLRGLEASITSDLPGTSVDGKLHWAEIPANGSALSSNAVRMSIPAQAACGQTFHTTANLKAGAKELALSKEWVLGFNEGTAKGFTAAGLPLVIKDFQTISANLNAADPAWKADTTVEKVELTFEMRHTFLGDLTIGLKGPDGALVQVYKGSGRGNGGVKFNADVSANFKGKKISGEWQLVVKDTAAGDEGSLTAYSVKLTPALYNCR